MNKNSTIYVAGAHGMVGSAICKSLKQKGFNKILTPSSIELDLISQIDVKNFFESNKIDYVFLAAAKVGGIKENSSKKAEFIYENLQIQSNIIHHAYLNKVKKLLFLGSSCIYPKNSIIPIKEENLLRGDLEKTNDAYAVAKIAGIQMCKSYREQYGFNAISVMPTNLYGPNDNFDQDSSHVLPALINKFFQAKKLQNSEVVCWGTGKPLREFLFVEDLADGLLFLMDNYDESEHINIGSGEEISIYELSKLIAEKIGYQGKIHWDENYPDGTFRKLLDSSLINRLGWRPKTSLSLGIDKVLKWLETS